jgi:ketosteroid isomerase-like protein
MNRYNAIETQIIDCENRLREAMLRSDVEALDELLSEDLIFTNHQGQLFSKQDDLEAHRSRIIKIQSITPLEQNIRIVGDVAIALVKVRIAGSIADVPSEGDFRFTRVWTATASGAWQIIVAHSTIAV